MAGQEEVFLDYAQRQQGELQRLALALTGDTAAAAQVASRALVRGYARWSRTSTSAGEATGASSDAALEQAVVHELTREAARWRRSPEGAALSQLEVDVSATERYDPEPLDVAALLEQGSAQGARVRSRRPWLVGAAVLAIGALVTAAVVRSQDDDDGRANPSPSGTSSSSTEVATDQVVLDCTVKSLADDDGSFTPPQRQVVAAGPAGVPVELRGSTFASDEPGTLAVAWSRTTENGDPVTIEDSGWFVLGRNPDATQVLPLGPGDWQLGCISTRDGGPFVELTVTDPTGAYRGTLEQAGCATRDGFYPLGGREYHGDSQDAALQHFVEAQPLFSLDGSPMTVVRADTGYTEAPTKTYLAVRRGLPQAAVEVRPSGSGWSAVTTTLCREPGESAPTDGSVDAEIAAPDLVNVSCAGSTIAVGQTRAVVGYDGLELSSGERQGAVIDWVRLPGAGGSQSQRGSVTVPKMRTTPVPASPGTVELTCAKGRAAGTTATITLIDPNGAWQGTAQDVGCTVEPLDEPVDLEFTDYGDDASQLKVWRLGYGDIFSAQALGYLGADRQQSLTGAANDGSRYVIEVGYPEGAGSGTTAHTTVRVLARCTVD